MPGKVLVTPRSFPRFKDQAYPLLEAAGYGIIENTTGRLLTEEEIIKFCRQGVVGIIAGIDPMPGFVLEQCPYLRAISRYGVGMDNIDLEKAEELGIKVRNATGTNNIAVAELTIALMLTVARHIPSAVQSVRSGGWERKMGFELTGRRLGIVGAGQIGKEVAKRARGLAMEVSIYDPYFADAEFIGRYQIELCGSLEALLQASDIISLHVPLTTETKGMINARALGLMKPGAVLINTSRGELVDEDALYDALTSGRIEAAAQDVFSSEPPDKGEKLLELENFYLTPHVGALTRESAQRMAIKSTRNLLEMLAEGEGKAGERQDERNYGIGSG